jgi:predicted HicB family RNase H-like nuclease
MAKAFKLRLPESLYKEIQEEAERERISMNQLMVLKLKAPSTKQKKPVKEKK